MRALLIHTDGYSIDVVGKYNTKEEASRTLYKEFEKMCSQDIDPEWQEQSHCDYEDAILYLNGRRCAMVLQLYLLKVEKRENMNSKIGKFKIQEMKQNWLFKMEQS